MINFPTNTQWSLVYQATRDGFRAEDFHSKCDNVSNTLTIIKSDIGQVFGGFTANNWFSLSPKFKPDANAFLFSLINSEKFPSKMTVKSALHAIVGDYTRGPVFGVGNDLSISNNSNENYDSRSNMDYSYLRPDYNKIMGFIPNKVSYLSDISKFRTAQIEVYTTSSKLFRFF